MEEVRKRGRPKGAKGHRNDGLSKHCGCARRRWPECSHPWFFAFTHNGTPYRFCLNKEIGKPINKPLPKTDAEAARDRFRGEIRAGTFRGGQTQAISDTTFGDLSDVYIKRYVQQPSRRPRSTSGMIYYVRAIGRVEIPAPGGASILVANKPLRMFTKADIEAMRHKWIGRRVGSRNGAVAANRMLSRLRHMFGWAVGEGLMEHHPFKRHGVTIVKLDSRVEQARTRRLLPDEEAKLLKYAAPHLQACIIAALETGMRRGELLSIQWRDVRWEQNVILLHGSNTKTYESRDVPISTRLKAVLEMRRTGPDGKEHAPEAYAFGNEVGERAVSIREAWERTCIRADITDLRFHDLRREFASRLLESGAPPHEVRDWLGHANITTTSRYLATTRVNLQRALRRFEEHRAVSDETGDKSKDKTAKSTSNCKQASRSEEPAAATSVN